MTTFRPATLDEIANDLAKLGPRRSVKHGTVEYINDRTMTGVAHRSHTRTSVRIVDGRAVATIHGKTEEVTAEVAEFTNDDGVARAIVCCYRAAWLKP